MQLVKIIMTLPLYMSFWGQPRGEIFKKKKSEKEILLMVAPAFMHWQRLKMWAEDANPAASQNEWLAAGGTAPKPPR